MKNLKLNRTEATLSLVVTIALVITLALTIASSIKKGTSNPERENMINLNETEAPGFLANNETQNPDTTIQNTKPNEITPQKNTPATQNDFDDRQAKIETVSPDSSSETKTAEPDVEVNSPKSVHALYSFGEADTLMMPINGSIILEYNMDNTIWFPTLGVYKCNPGIYIGANVGDAVISSCTGKVESIYTDKELGNSILVDLGNGYQATYGGLDNIQVLEGELIFAGTTLGNVANPTAYYTLEGSGIYFSLTKDGLPENPLDYME